MKTLKLSGKMVNNYEKPMSYQRVIPRDLFNESKLLKCLGQLSLAILDNVVRNVQLEHSEEHQPGFYIEQDTGSGELYCYNMACFRVSDGEPIYLVSPYNSHNPYPLKFYTPNNDDRQPVFDENGNPTPEFLDAIKP